MKNGKIVTRDAARFRSSSYLRNVPLKLPADWYLKFPSEDYRICNSAQAIILNPYGVFGFRAGNSPGFTGGYKY
jgi:hypothetical protein